MESAILQRLNIIRKLEQEKLFDKTLDVLKSYKSSRQHPLPADLLKNLNKLILQIEHDNNYGRSIDNLNKLSRLLLNNIKKNNRINEQLNNITDEIRRLKESHPESLSDNGAENSDCVIYNGLEAFISEINKELNELSPKINAFLPEQPDFKPLDPFGFINKNIQISKEKISVIILNENGAPNLQNLFDSFIRHASYKKFEIVLIDRASTDNSIEISNSFKDRLPLNIIISDQKFTNSYLYNRAADTCNSEYLLFLNNKATFRNDLPGLFLENYKKADSPGILGPLIISQINREGDASVDFYGSIKFTIDEIPGLPDIPFPIINPRFLIRSGLKKTILNYRKEGVIFTPPGFSLACIKPVPAKHQKKGGTEKVPAIPGYALFCKRADFILAGGFDLNYIDGFEDIDLCLKFAASLHKDTLLVHDVILQINQESLMAEPENPYETAYEYNLGTLLNRFGYYIKNKYFTDLLQDRQVWTKDTIESIGKGTPSDPIDRKDKKLIKRLATSCLDGLRNSKLRIAIKAPAFNDERTQFWGDYHFAQSLKNSFIRKGHVARVDLHDFWYEHGYLADDVVIVLRGTKNYHTRGSQINIMWNISHPEQVGPLEYQDYDHVFVASNVFAEELREKWGIEAENLLQCTDRKLFYPDSEVTKDEEKTDILFVGNSRGVMRKSIKYSLERNIPVTLYGTKWENLMPVGMIKGNYIKNEELRKYYSNCEILLNDHWDDMVVSGFISNRIFDALACGAIVLTDRVKGIEKTFPDGLFYYATGDELEEKIKWIRENYREVKHQAMKNSKKVLQKHTFDIRAEKILEIALKIHEQKISFKKAVEPAGKNLLSHLLGSKNA